MITETLHISKTHEKSLDRQVDDKIGRQNFVNQIYTLIDMLKPNENFCLCIDGAWGSGKSFVMDLLEKKLTEYPEYLIIRYDAWENSFYADPLIAILSCIIDGLNGRFPIKAKINSTIKTVSEVTADYFPSWKKIREIVESIRKIIKKFNSPIDTKIATEFHSYQTLLENTKSCLNSITSSCGKKQTKIVFLVDEIDRCLPDEQLKILERIHHLLDIENCAVIIAMNCTCVKKTIETIYGIDGQEYLRKFFNFKFMLEMSSCQYFKKLCMEYASHFEKLGNQFYQCKYAARMAYEYISQEPTKEINFIDNREITQYFENIEAINNKFGWENLTPEYVFFIILGLFFKNYIDKDFLTNDEMKYNETHMADRPYIETDNGIICLDYIGEYLHMNQIALDKSDEDFNHMNHFSIINLFISFSEIVFYMSGDKSYHNEMRMFEGKPAIHIEEITKLRELILLYANNYDRQ